MGTQAIFRFSPSAVEIEFNVGFSPMAGFLNMIKADGDRDDAVSVAESEVFADALLDVVLPQLSLTIDQEALSLTSQSRRIEGLIGGVGQLAFDIFYTLRAELPEPIGERVRILQFKDGSFANETSSQINWFPLEENSRISFLVVDPATELVVDALRAQCRSVTVLLSSGTQSLHAWATEHGFLTSAGEATSTMDTDAFASISRDRLPVAELTLGAEKTAVCILAEQPPPASRWEYRITAGDRTISWELLTEKPYEADQAFTLQTFRIDTSELGPQPALRISITRPRVREFRLAVEGHDPGIKWTILTPGLMKDGGFYSVPGPEITVQWKRLEFVKQASKPHARPSDKPWKPVSEKLPSAEGGGSDPLLQKLQELKQSLEEGTLGVVGFLFMCLFALVYGAAHAFGPGHGKSLVAAYLAGRRGRIRDAVILGTIVTFTHLASVYLLALGGLLILQVQSETAFRDHVVVAMQLLSALLLFGLGVALFYRFLRGTGFDHHHHHHHLSHEHEHIHDASHAHEHGNSAPHHHPAEERTSFSQLLYVGLTGGMVPCPAGLLVVFVSWNLNLFWAALALLFFLSLGLGGSLIGLGISVVLARKTFDLGAGRRAPGPIRRFVGVVLPKLPALSGLAIAILGLLLFYLTIVRQGSQVAALLRAVATALSPEG